MKPFQKVLLFILLPIVIVFIILFFILNSMFFNINLDKLNGTGKIQEVYTSPNGKYKAELFIINKGGATVNYQERVSITSLKDKHREFNDKTIYWVYPYEENPIIKWKNSDTIVINDKTIDIHNKKTYYNWKKDEDFN